MEKTEPLFPGPVERCLTVVLGSHVCLVRGVNVEMMFLLL